MTTNTSNQKKRLPYDSELISAIRDHNLNSACLHVLVYLRSKMNKKRMDYKCWPSQKTIRSDTGLDERTIRRALKNLQSAGLINISKRRTGSNLLQYELIPWWPSNTETSGQKCTNGTGQKCRYDAVKNVPNHPVKNVGSNRSKMSVQNNRSESENGNKGNKSSSPSRPSQKHEDDDETPSSKVQKKVRRKKDWFSVSEGKKKNPVSNSTNEKGVSPPAPPTLKSSFNPPEGFPPAMDENRFRELYGYGFADVPDLLNDSKIDLALLILPFKERNSDGKPFLNSLQLNFRTFTTR